MTKSDKRQVSVLFGLGILLFLIMITGQAFRYIGQPMPVDDGTLIQRMKAKCTESHYAIDGKLEQDCGDLQDQLAARGYETLYKDGKFWVEQ